MLFKYLKTLTEKLGISEPDGALIVSFTRGYVNTLGKRRLYALLQDIVERFGLDDRDMGRTYGQQLVEKGILTEIEGKLFTGDLDYATRLAERKTETEEVATDNAADFDSKA